MSAYSDGEVVMFGRSQLGNSLPRQTYLCPLVRGIGLRWTSVRRQQEESVLCWVLHICLVLLDYFKKKRNQLFKGDPDWCILLVWLRHMSLSAMVRFAADFGLFPHKVRGRRNRPAAPAVRRRSNFFAGGLQDHPVALQHRIPSSLADVVFCFLWCFFFGGGILRGRNKKWILAKWWEMTNESAWSLFQRKNRKIGDLRPWIFEPLHSWFSTTF